MTTPTLPSFMNQLTIGAEHHILALRDAADQDYILARVAFRLELYAQFIWLGQQAVEKYLKALLLFNGLNARVDHDLALALERLKTVTDVPFAFPKGVREFIDYVNRSADRYAERPYSVTTRRLMELDATVWFLRRFCVNLRGNQEKRLRLKKQEILAEIAARADPSYVASPHQFWLTGGFLDEVRRDRTSALRPHLSWNNLFFTRRRRVPASVFRSRMVNSYLNLYPHARAELGQRLKFAK